jgi:outer membrane protein assembly factor BamB
VARTDGRSSAREPRLRSSDGWRRVALAGAALLVAALAVATLQSADLTAGGLGEPARDVDLTDETTGAPLEAAGEVADDQRAELRAQAAGARLRCEPRGCERWRLTLADEWARISSTDDQVLFLRDGSLGTDRGASSGEDPGPAELLVIDARTGEEIVRRDLEIERAVRGRPGRGAQPGSFAAAVLADGIALAIDGTIVSMSLEGETRWQERLTDGRIWYLRSHGDRLLVFGGDLRFRDIISDRASGPREQGRVHVLDRDTGALLWSAPGELSGTLDEEVAVISASVGDGLVTRAHDVDDGTVRWERATAHVVRSSPEQDHVVLASGREGEGDVLVDAHTGADLLPLEGTLVTTMHQADGRSYLLVDRMPRDGDDRGAVVDGDSELAVLALDASAQLAWRTEVEGSLTGYARLSAQADRLFLISERGATVSFDLASGAMQHVDPATDAAAGTEVWTDADGREIRQTADGLRIESPVGRVQIRGEHGAWLIDQDPLLVTDGSTLLAVDLVPE